MNREKEIGGNHWNQKGHPDHTDAMFRAYTKTIPPTIVGSGAFGVLDRTEFGEEVASSSWGGWIAAGSYDDYSAYGHSFVVGFAGADLNLTLESLGYTTVIGMADHDDRLIVLGRNTGRGVVWLSSISNKGEELSRHEHQFCPGVRSLLSTTVAQEDFIWALGSVWTSQELTSPLLVRFHYGGQIESIWAFAIEADYYDVEALEVTDGGRCMSEDFYEWAMTAA